MLHGRCRDAYALVILACEKERQPAQRMAELFMTDPELISGVLAGSAPAMRKDRPGVTGWSIAVCAAVRLLLETDSTPEEIAAAIH